MTTLTIKLNDSLQQFVETQAAEAGHSTPGEFVQTLLQELQKKKAKEKVEALLLEGLHSGEGVELTPRVWEEMRQEGLKLLADWKAQSS